MQKATRKIAIIGPYPPPYGGISVHIKRVLEYLPSDSFFFYNSNKSFCEKAVPFYGKIKFLKVLIFLFKEYKIVHTHSTDPLLRILFGIIGIFRKNIYLHIHGESLTNYLNKKHLGSRIMKKLIKRLHIIACNSVLEEKISKYNPRSIKEIDAFLPPRFNQETLAYVLNRYKDFFKKNRFIISMTGWFDYYKNEDLYGFDMAVELLKRFLDMGKNIYLVEGINKIRNHDLYSSHLQFIKKNKLEDHVLMVNEDLKEFWYIFILSQVFIRPTNTDGSSVSIKEAQWVGTPVIASDCIVRPEGVILFKTRSLDDLCDKLYGLYVKPVLSLYEKKELIKTKTYTSKLLSEVYKI